MKKTISLPLMALAGAVVLSSCSADWSDSVSETLSSQTVTPLATTDITFPADDGAKALSTTPVLALMQLMMKVDPNIILEAGETPITEAEYAEIKTFVDENLVGSTPKDTYDAIFKWITTNVKYAGSTEQAWLRPYDVFVNKRCICQGFANLLKIMCQTQGIPACCVNGQLGSYGAHAWNYVYTGKWWVSDPTNGGEYSMMNATAYQTWLVPQRADFDFYEDDNCYYNFNYSTLNVDKVKDTAGETLIIPFSIDNFQISAFSPSEILPTQVKRLCLGKNIVTLGGNVTALPYYTPSVEEIYVDEENPNYVVEDNILYARGATLPTYIPPSTRRVVLKSMTVLEKNIVVDLPYVEEIVIADGTETIEDYAIENCPNLLRIYVPSSVTSIADEAFYRCGDKYEVIRVDSTTGIHPVTM